MSPLEGIADELAEAVHVTEVPKRKSRARHPDALDQAGRP